MQRRHFLTAAAAAPFVWGADKAKLTSKQRVDRALAGSGVDRVPFTFWHHFGLHTPEEHAKATLDFHNSYRTDIVKVMSDFPYPKASGKWYELKVEQNPFPQQIRSLELIRDGLGGKAYFIETLFNPWNVAEKLSSKEEVRRLMKENPQALLNALDAITQSEINHAKRAFATGASGVLLSVANATSKELSRADYEKFSAPFDKRILDATAEVKLNVLHLHVEPSYLSAFRTFQVPVINYSQHVSGIPLAEMRKQSTAVLMGGIDEVHYRTLKPEELRAQWQAAAKAAGPKFILTPGCSVPDQSQAAELTRLPQLVGA